MFYYTSNLVLAYLNLKNHHCGPTKGKNYKRNDISFN